MPDYTNTGVIPAGKTSVSVPITFNDSFYIYEIEQITISYVGGANDSPNAGISKNGTAYGGASPLLPGIISNGLSQTWGNPPSLFMEIKDDVECVVTNGTAGATVTVFAQFLRHRNNDPEYQDRKSTG